MASSRSSSASFSPSWQRVAAAIRAAPGAAAVEEPRLALLLEKVRNAAYTITDADVAGLDPDLVIEASLAVALDEAEERLGRALEVLS
ncbi:MAG TPA: hypothetical protein VFA56_07315 [Gaiellaceae bacterium]|nr:hypothetical protein [Gaiellaceae bacterium]